MFQRWLKVALVVAATACLTQDAQGVGHARRRGVCDYFFGGYCRGIFGYGLTPCDCINPYGYGYDTSYCAGVGCTRWPIAVPCFDEIPPDSNDADSSDSESNDAVPVNSDPVDSDYPASTSSIQVDGHRISLTVNVPADAKLWINGLATKSTGESRTFTCGGLEPDGQYEFVLRCEFERDGEPTSEERTIKLTAGQTGTLAFNELSAASPPQIASSDKP